MDYSILLKEWAEKQPEKTFLITPQGSFSYEDITAQAVAYAEFLKAHQVGHRSLLIVRQHPLTQLVCFLGAQLAGCVPILGHTDLSSEAARELAEERHIGWVDLDGFLSRTGNEQQPPEAVCMGVLSSGSTGLPKVMYRTFGSWADFFPEQNEKFRTTQDTVAFVEGSMSFTGNLSVFAGVLFAGGTLVAAESLYTRTWAEALEHYQVSLLYLVPVKLKLLLRSLTKVYPAMAAVMAGSQLLDGETASALKHHFPNSEIFLYYGASELNYITWLTYEELLQHPMSVGKPCPGVKVTLQDGMIYVDSPYHVYGLTMPCTIGDQGYFDQDGYLIFLGRKGQIVNKGGMTISCARVEQALLRVPYVEDAAVVPCEDAQRGQELGACVVLKEGADLSKVRKVLHTYLLPGEIPGRWKQVSALPLNAVGKVDSKKLAQWFHKEI